MPLSGRLSRRTRQRRSAWAAYSQVLEERVLLAGQTISDSGGFEGSQQTLQLEGNGGGTIEYSYEHFVIPDNFAIRYEGKNLLETGFVGGSRSGMIQVPAGNSDTVDVIVTTNDQGTAWNYTVTANGCGQTDPLNIELASGEFEAKEVNGKTVCSGSGTVFLGRSDGIGRMLRVEGATAEYDDTKVTISGRVFSEIGAGDVLTAPLFAGSFEIPFKTGISSSFSETGAGPNEYTLGGVGVDFSNISINRNSVSLGARFELLEDLGLPDHVFSGQDGLIIRQNNVVIGPSIRFSAPNFKNFNLFGFVPIEEFSGFAIEYIAPQDTLKIQGKLAVDLSSKPRTGKVVANLADPNFIQIKGGEVDLKGELTIETNLKFPPKGWGLRGLKLTIDTINRDVGGGAILTLPIGRTVKVDGEIGFKTPIPPLELNKLSLGVDNLNIPVPGYPLVFFQGFRGAAENFAASDSDPIEFSGGVSATLGPQILGKSAIRLDLDGKLSAEQLSGTATVTVVDPKVLQSTGTATLNWEKKFFETRGTFTLLDGLIVTSDSFRATSNFDVKMGGQAQVNIPNSVPLWGGANIGTGDYLVDFSNNGNSSDDFAAGWGTLRVQKLGFDINLVIGFKGYFDGRIERIGAKNIPPTGSWDIAADTDWFVVGADWENTTTDDVPVRVQRPDGTWIDEADFAANNIAIVDELTGDNSKVLVVFDPEPGVWDMEVVAPASLGEIQYNAAEEAAGPFVEVKTPVGTVPGGEVTIDYAASDPDSDAEVRFFYDTDDTGFDGVQFAEGIVENDGDGSIVWNTEGVADGDYYVYAMITDGDNAPVYSYSAGLVSVSEVADLAVSQSAPDPIRSGDEVVFTFGVDNLGVDRAMDSLAIVTLPDDVTLVSASRAFVPDGNTLTFDLGNIGEGMARSFDVTVEAPGMAGSFLMDITASTTTFDSSAQNDAVELVYVVEDAPVLLPDLEVIVSNAADDVLLGESFTYELTVNNNGLGPATDVVLTEIVPSNTRSTSATVSQGTSQVSGRTVTASLGTLQPGESALVTITVSADSAGDLVSTTTLASNEEDLGTTDNFLITINTVVAVEPSPADLEVMVSASNANPSPGDQIDVSVTVSNSGPGIASGILIDSILPPELNFVSWSAGQGVYDSTTGQWNVGNVRDELARTLTITAEVVSGGTFDVSAEVTAVFEDDPDSAPDNGDMSEDDFASVNITAGLGCDATGTGNVRVRRLANGRILITGDAMSNAVAITHQDGSVWVTGLGKTEINRGDEPFQLAEGTDRISGDVRIDMKAGHDTLCVQSVEFAENLTFFGRGGHDVFAGSEIHVDGRFKALFGAGRDPFAVDDMEIDGIAEVRLGAGDDNVLARNLRFDNTARVFAGGGNDLFAVTDFHAKRNVNMWLGAGDDQLATIGENRFDRKLRVVGNVGKDAHDISQDTDVDRKPKLISFRSSSISDLSDQLESAIDQLMESGISVGNLLD